MTFRLSPGLLAAVLVALAILVSLGTWQFQRLEWKRDLIEAMNERLAAAPIAFDEALARAVGGERMDYQPVYLAGAYAHDLESAVFGTYEGRPGVYVFTPLDAADPATGGRRFVYVNRGFAPQDFRDPQTRGEGLAAGQLRVEGLFRSAEEKRGFEKWLAPKDQPADNLYFVRDPRILAARHTIDVPRFYIDSFGRESAGPWPKGGLTRVDLPNRHFEYALTWFGLAAALLGVFIAYSLKRA
ncbi:MAG: SURF1 family protein [Pseudomonadota bacterium]